MRQMSGQSFSKSRALCMPWANSSGCTTELKAASAFRAWKASGDLDELAMSINQSPTDCFVGIALHLLHISKTKTKCKSRHQDGTEATCLIISTRIDGASPHLATAGNKVRLVTWHVPLWPLPQLAWWGWWPVADVKSPDPRPAL